MVVKTKGRPPAGYRAKSVVAAVCERIANGKLRSDRERKLASAFGRDAKQMADAIIKQSWLDKNIAAMCHKLAISAIEEIMAAYATELLITGTPSPTLRPKADALTKALTARSEDQQVQKRLLSKLDEMDLVLQRGHGQQEAEELRDLCNDFVTHANKASTNFFVGDARINSAIHEFFDPHYDHDPTSTALAVASPDSQAIYFAEHEFAPLLGRAPSSPNREAAFVQSSSADRATVGDLLEAGVTKLGTYL